MKDIIQGRANVVSLLLFLLAVCPILRAEGSVVTDSLGEHDDVVLGEPRPISFYGGKNVIEDYTLQSPRISKRFDKKKLFDHAFVEGGLGANTMMGRNVSGHLTKLSPSLFGSVGDWITPEHGWRATGSIGYFNHPMSSRAKFMSLELDYLMNLTALSEWEYPTYNRFEIIGVAGLSLFNSHQNGETKTGWGASLGLKGQYHFSSYTYVFAEPKATLNYNMLHGNVWYKVRPSLSLSAGVGFSYPRISTKSKMYADNPAISGMGEWPVHEYNSDGHWLNDTYVTVLGGPSLISNFHPSTWKNYVGSKFKFAVGKMFSPYLGAQLSLNGGINKVCDLGWHAKTYGIGAEAVWNVHNTFGGYNPDRLFTLNALAGIGYNIDMYGTSTKHQNYSWSFGGGLQARLRLAEGVDFVAEPRIDIYSDKFIPVSYSMPNHDVITSLLFGFNFHQGLNSRQQIERNREYSQESWYDDMFAQIGLGLGVPFSFNAGHNYEKAFRPQGFIGLGKWFSATSGARAWVDMGTVWQDRNAVNRFAAYGVDYMWNMSNAFHGYKADRKFFLNGGLGFNIMSLRDHDNSYLGAQVSVQGLYKINSLYGIFLEPQARFYDKNALKYSDCFPKNSILLNVLAGVQVSMKGYKPGYYGDFSKEEGRSFFSVGAGLTTPIRLLKHANGYGRTMKISYGKWYSPISAWRISGWGYINKLFGARYGIASASLDYILDASAFTFGYNPDRIVSTRVIAGADMGLDYQKENVRFVPQIHFGGQLAIKLSSNAELFAEPQFIYSLSDRFDSRLLKTSLQGIVGINYLFDQNNVKRDLSLSDKRNFVSVAFALGMTSGKSNSLSTYKLKPGSTISFGHWLNGLSGVRASLSFNGTNDSNQMLWQLHFDYMMNMVTALTGRNTQDDKVQLRGLLGVNAGIVTKSSHKTNKGLGLEVGTQVAYVLSSNTELFVEPTAQILSNNLFNYHTFDSLLDCKFGINYRF